MPVVADTLPSHLAEGNWQQRKMAQWLRVRETMPGLQLIRSGDAKSIFTLACGHESVVYGRPFRSMKVPRQRQRPPLRREDWREAAEHEKPLAKRAVDFSDADLDAVLALWSLGQSALSLAFVDRVWGADGQPRDK